MSIDLYTILFIISIIFFGVLISAFRNRISSFYVLLFSSILICCFGYMQLASADSMKMALFANQTAYLGGSVSPFFLLMCLADLCKVNIRRRYQVILLSMGLMIFGLVSTVGVVDWYYKSISIEIINDVVHISKEYGPLHVLYYIYLALNVSLCFGVVFHALIKKKSVSAFTVSMLLVALFITVGFYAVERVIKIDIELVPIGYIVSELLTLILLFRISLFDVARITAEAMIKDEGFGFILVDRKGLFLGASDMAQKWFPELKDVRIDAQTKNLDTELFGYVDRWMRKIEEKEKVLIQCDKRSIEVSHTILSENKYNEVHCIYLRDDTKQQEYNKLLKKYNEALTKNMNEQSDRLNMIQDDIIIGMASIVENRDGNTGGHIVRTSDIVKIFVDHLMAKENVKGLNSDIADAIVKAAPLHDFGKIAIPDSILNKNGKFEPWEYEQMKAHAEKGALIVAQILRNVKNSTFKRIAINVAHYHHEKWDGNGYPEKIQGLDIPFEARVMALADVFDALVSKRVYKEKYSYDKAFSIIEESSGTHFDPVLCKAFLECRPELEKLYDSYGDED